MQYTKAFTGGWSKFQDGNVGKGIQWNTDERLGPYPIYNKKPLLKFLDINIKE